MFNFKKEPSDGVKVLKMDKQKKQQHKTAGPPPGHSPGFPPPKHPPQPRMPYSSDVVDQQVDPYSTGPSKEPESIGPQSYKDDPEEQPQEGNFPLSCKGNDVMGEPSQQMDFAAACQFELSPKLQLYVQAARDLVQHRHTGMAWFREAADDLDVAYKRVAAAKIVGSGLGIAGGILGVVGGGLLLGGVTAPAGIAVLGVSVGLGVGGGITGVGATAGDIVNNRRTLKRANEWIRQGSELCRELIKKHNDYHEGLEGIMERYEKQKELVIETTIGRNHGRKDLDIDVDEFQKADNQALLTITEWKKVLEMGAEASATAFVTGTPIPGAVSRGVLEGVEAGAGTGVTGLRFAVTAAGGVVIGMSALFVVVDLALIGKTAYDLNKYKKGTELSQKLHQAASDMEKETAQLRPLANFANEL